MQDWPEVQLVFKGNSDAGPPAARCIVLTSGHPYSLVCKVTQNFFLCLELYFLAGLKLGSLVFQSNLRQVMFSTIFGLKGFLV